MKKQCETALRLFLFFAVKFRSAGSEGSKGHFRSSEDFENHY